MRTRTFVSALAWTLLLIFAATSVARELPLGHGLLVVLTPAWLLSVTFLRSLSRRLRGRPARLLADGAFAAICVLLWPFGGWWVLPAIVAFGLLDGLAGPEAKGLAVQLPREVELVLGGLTLVAAVTLTILLANSAVYSYRSGSISGTGEVTETQGTYGLPLAVGLLFFIAPALAIAAGAVRDYRRRGSGRGLIGTIALALAVLSVLGGFSIGLFLVPIALLAVLTYVAASATGRSPADPASHGLR